MRQTIIAAVDIGTWILLLNLIVTHRSFAEIIQRFLLCFKTFVLSAGISSELLFTGRPIFKNTGLPAVSHCIKFLFHDQNKTKKAYRTCNKPFYRIAYSAAIAPAGQTLAQLPQEMQEPASIARVPSPLSAIAPTGHSPSHAPQEMQAELSTT